VLLELFDGDFTVGGHDKVLRRRRRDEEEREGEVVRERKRREFEALCLVNT